WIDGEKRHATLAVLGRQIVDASGIKPGQRALGAQEDNDYGLAVVQTGERVLLAPDIVEDETIDLLANLARPGLFGQGRQAEENRRRQKCQHSTHRITSKEPGR